MVSGDVVLRGCHRRFGDFRRQHAFEVTRQRQREVAVTAVELQQIARRPFRRIQRPLQHLHVHGGIRLGEAVLHLTVNHLFSCHRQTLVDVILVQHDFGFGRAANQVHVDILRAQRIAQGFCLLAPLVSQCFVIEQRNNGLIALGGQVVNLEQLVAQYRIVAHTVDHQRHQLVDKLTRRRKTVYANTGFRLLIENDVVQVIAIVPDAKLSAHTVVADRRTKHLGNGRVERRHHTLQADNFFCQLCVVLFCREVFGGHDAS